MAKHGTIISITIVLLAIALFAHAEKATEIMIPIGQSPGLSGKVTVLGKIDQVDRERRKLTVTDAAGTYTISIAGSTYIFLDRSNIRKPSAYGSIADCKPGQRIEVKWQDNDRNQPAEWIKVQSSP